jgi:hypothetical protein
MFDLVLVTLRPGVLFKEKESIVIFKSRPVDMFLFDKLRSLGDAMTWIIMVDYTQITDYDMSRWFTVK